MDIWDMLMHHMMYRLWPEHWPLWLRAFLSSVIVGCSALLLLESIVFVAVVYR